MHALSGLKKFRMHKEVEEEIEEIATALKYSDYHSLNEFLEMLYGYEKFTGHRFKMKDYKYIERVRNEKDKALLLKRFTLICKKDRLKQCTASIELGRNGDLLKVFKFDDHHNHSGPECVLYYCFKEASLEENASCKNGYLRKIFSYPSVERKLIYDHCSAKFCDSQYLLLQTRNKLYVVRENLIHTHGLICPLFEPHEQIGPRNVGENYRTYFRMALGAVAKGLLAKNEAEMDLAAEDFMGLLKEHAKNL
nr:hypothetical protein HmN_000165600 [Hymenolepis microstoma]